MAFPLVSEGLRSSLFFGVYGKVLDLSGRPQNSASYSEIAVAAAVGGGVQGIAATPVELVKILLQSPNGQLTNLIYGHSRYKTDLLRAVNTEQPE